MLRIRFVSIRRRLSVLAAALPVLMSIILAASPAAQADKVNQSLLGGVAIEGYDPVAYFTEGRPVEGSDDFTVDWKDATWRFASAEHKRLFEASPEKYAPAYGGYCAWAVSQGYTADIDPQAWKIVDDTLYLNYSPSIQTKWAKDIPGNIEKGDANWPEIESEL